MLGRPLPRRHRATPIRAKTPATGRSRRQRPRQPSSATRLRKVVSRKHPPDQRGTHQNRSPWNPVRLTDVSRDVSRAVGPRVRGGARGRPSLSPLGGSRSSRCKRATATRVSRCQEPRKGCRPASRAHRPCAAPHATRRPRLRPAGTSAPRDQRPKTPHASQRSAPPAGRSREPADPTTRRAATPTRSLPYDARSSALRSSPPARRYAH